MGTRRDKRETLGETDVRQREREEETEGNKER